MAHESFADTETAALMNDLFVNIKVDREERPDVDALYQTALALMTGRGGWPLTLFLTPYGEPFFGGTYFPPVARQGASAFRDVLQSVHQVFVTQPDKVEIQRVAVLRALEGVSRQEPGDGLSMTDTDTVAARLLAEVDMTHGGFGGAPKFPQPGALQLLWRAHLRTGQNDFRSAVLLTAERICQGGIYDHIGGGFHRYATDERWFVPHFEKMLYDNAMLIDLLGLIWQGTKNDLFVRRISEVAAWTLREMVLPDGGFASSQDADAEGEEGRFYVWSAAEIDRLLGVDSEAFKSAYDIREQGNWEGRNIPNCLQAPPVAPEDEPQLAAMRKRLLNARAQRLRPHRDDKVQADWNGMMIAALANAAAVFDVPAWLAVAKRAFEFVTTRMEPDHGRLSHSFCSGLGTPLAVLDDYANMARAALVLHETTNDTAYVAAAERWTATAYQHYWDRKFGGYFFTADHGEGLIIRTKSANDSPLPSGNGTMLGVLARLHMLTGKRDYRTRADAIASAFGGQIPKNIAARATLFNENEMLSQAVQIVLIGRSEVATAPLRRVIFDSCLPNRLLLHVAPNAVLPEDHVAAGKTPLEGRPTAYVCIGSSCSVPACDADSLRSALGLR
jgi:uncharacterized protein YyaL (SSP411 family)